MRNRKRTAGLRQRTIQQLGVGYLTCLRKRGGPIHWVLITSLVAIWSSTAGVRHAPAVADIHNYSGFICASSICQRYHDSVAPWCELPIFEWHLSYMCSYERSYQACLERVFDDCLDSANGAAMVGGTGGAASGAIGAAASGGPVGWTALAGGAGVGAISWVTALFWCKHLSSVAGRERADCLNAWNRSKALQERAFKEAQAYYRQIDKDWDLNGLCDECWQ